MQRFKLVGLAMLAVVMFSAVATAAASAHELPWVLPEEAFTFKAANVGNSILLSTAGSLISCEKSSSSGAFAAGSINTTAEIKFEKCTANGTTTKCKSLGGTAGNIIFNAEVHLVTVLNAASELLLGLLVLLPSALLHLECGVLLILVLGAVIGIFLNAKHEPLKTLEKIKKGFLDFEQKPSGLQVYRTCDEPLAVCESGGKKVEYLLKSEFGSGEELSAEETTQEIELSKELEIHF